MKKLFAIVLALVLGTSACALTLDTAENFTEETTTAVLSEETTESNVGKPGYNLWTGTTGAYTFDGNLVLSDSSTSGDINKAWASASDVYIANDGGNASIHMKGDRTRFSVNMPFSIEGTRPVSMSFKFKNTAAAAIYMSVRNKPGYWLNGASPFIWESAAYQVNMNYNVGNWVAQSKVITPADARHSTYDAAPDTVTTFWFQLAAYYGTSVYIDDVSFIPHYKVTYDLNGGEGTTPATEYFLADSYTLKADTSSIMAPGGVAAFSHWEDQFGRKITDTVTPVLGEDVILTAVYVDDAKKNSPGINLWTGTTEAYGFEGDLELTDYATGDINKNWAAATDIFIADFDGNQAIHLKGNRSSFSVNATFSIDADRPVTLKYRFKTDATSDMWMTARTNKAGYWKTSPSTFFVWESNAYKVNLAAGDTGNWTPQEKTFLPKDGINPTYDTAPTTAERFWFQLATNYTIPVYIDDVSFIPNYKITYDLGEGTGETPADEYFLADEYTLKADLSKINAPAGKVFAYWLDQDFNQFYDKVTPTVGQDLILTAVYEDINTNFRTLDVASMRTTGRQGIRTVSFISDSFVAMADEYGYIVTTEKQLGDAAATTLTFENTELVKLSGAAYIKGTDTNLIYCNDKDEAKELFGNKAIDMDGVYFTTVFTNIPETKDAYTTDIIGRCYFKLGNTYYYGTPFVKNVYDVAKTLKANYEAEGKTVPAEVLKVIEVVEG